jgi:hypothetical protein
MNLRKINTAEAEAKRFLEKVKAVKSRAKEERLIFLTGCRETGALRRASMDLSNALVELRKSG